ncbi:hypothetical protein BC833DRAFT_564208 [Globomyces pollinis-pini]|nr:hypothetical protein BC833DRAFT_564208 [Globomyces pollinis-pini]KAJ2998870.1 hypothetical protein HDV02_003980 [Globomyces sp. JEL0801]
MNYAQINPKEPDVSSRDTNFICLSTYRILYDPNGTQIVFKNGNMIPKDSDNWYPQFVQSVHSLLEKTQLNLPTILIAMMLLARTRAIVNRFKGFEFSFFMAAQKTYSPESQHFTNEMWAAMSQYAVDEINELERQFYVMVDGKLNIRHDQYEQFVGALQHLGKEHVSVH